MSDNSDKRLITWSNRDERIIIYPCGADAFRVVIRRDRRFANDRSAIAEGIPDIDRFDDQAVSASNGLIRADIDAAGRISFHDNRNGALVLAEAAQSGSPIKRQPARFYRPTGANSASLRVEFNASEERIWGMGQQRHAHADHKGSVIDLQTTNGEYSIPFYVSSRGYGFLWNHPGTGKVTFARNRTLWEMDECDQIDYWVVLGADYRSIVESYVRITGLPPKVPQRMLGYWQSKLRYKTQAEVLAVAQTFAEKRIPVDVIVIDFFHWPALGDFRFKSEDFPDPKAMVAQLREMGIEVMVSVWPAVSTDSENITRIEAERLIVRNRNGLDIQRHFIKGFADEHAKASQHKVRDYVYFFDFFNPEARDFIWEKVRQNYYAHGIRHFWIDANEPPLNRFDFEQLCYHGGSGAAQGNLYANQGVTGFRKGLDEEGDPEAMILCRGAWAGIQRSGAATWSGDILSTFEELRMQITMSLHAAVSGLHLWHTDIGGFKLGGPMQNSPEFIELLLRWFEWGVFSPVCRMHGHRSPNEPWSYGEEAEQLMTELIRLRYRLRPYLQRELDRTSQTGLPLVRPLWLEYAADDRCLDIADQYLLGDRLMIAPVSVYGARSRQVYLPDGELWFDAWTGAALDAGTEVSVAAPLGRIPVFLRKHAEPVW